MWKGGAISDEFAVVGGAIGGEFDVVDVAIGNTVILLL